MKLVVALITSFLLVACTVPTTVHLNVKYLDQDAQQEIVTDLTTAGFNVVTNKVDFPGNHLQSTIIYSPLIKNTDSVNTLLSTVKKRDYQVVQVDMLANSNHWYTKDSIGLYLLPTDFKPAKQTINDKMVGDYVTHNCEHDASLSIKQSGEWTYQYSGGDDVKGNWSILDSTYLFIERDEPWINLYFEFSFSQQTDMLGSVNITKLVPLNDSSYIVKCGFIKGIRQ